MKFLTDENIATYVVDTLRNQGFDVKDVKEEGLNGTSDRVLINIANEDDRIIITHDKNFGHLLTQLNIIHNGVIMIRCKNQHYTNAADILLKFLNSKLIDKCKNNVVILSEEQVNINSRS